MKDNNIPVGYQLHVTSWENDADNYQTEIVSGLSGEDVKYLLEILSNFGRSGDFGNDNVEDDELFEVFTSTMEKHPLVSPAVMLYQPEGAGEARDAINDLLGNASEGYDHSFVRYFDSYEVFYVPHEIVDVSDQFK